MPDLTLRAQVGLISFKVESYENTLGGTTRSIFINSDEHPDSISVCLQESKRFMRTVITVREDVRENLELEKDKGDWSVHARLAHGATLFNAVSDYIERLTTKDQYWEVLHYVWDSYLKHVISRKDLGYFNDYIHRGNVTSTETIRKWVPSMAACFNRNERPEWVRSSHGLPMHNV